MMKNLFYYETKIGLIGIAEEDGQITHLFFHGEIAPAGYSVLETPILRHANEQLQEYFQGKREEFSLPLAPSGTKFMQQVWDALRKIPYGETRSYKGIATAIGNSKSCRAVGMANNRNPIAIIIPCHRVVGSDGSLVGYAAGLEIKSFLLDHENQSRSSKIRLDHEG